MFPETKFEITYNRPRGGGQLGIESQNLKTLEFDYLKNHRFHMFVIAFTAKLSQRHDQTDCSG